MQSLGSCFKYTFCIQNFLENGTIFMFSGQLKDKENSSSETFEDSALLNLPF